MRENYAGLSVSAIVHFLVVAAFFVLPIEKYSKPKNMLIDFTIEKGMGTGSSERTAGVNKGEGTGKVQGMPDIRTEDARPRRIEQTSVNYGTQSLETKGQHSKESHYSDPQGQMVVHGSTGSSGDFVGTRDGKSSEKGIPGIAHGGQGRALNYESGGPAERSFSFIRETIIKNIQYPERARRMGWEGKVLLSFVVLENGSVREVKVLNSSGFMILDENAKEAVLKATFSKKIPYRLVIVLPVEYKLE